MSSSGHQRPPDEQGSAAGRRTRLVTDAMLGSLTRKLRAFGFDVVYHESGGDEGIMRMARKEGRVILTSDRELYARASSAAVPALLVEGKTEGRRIRSLLVAAKSAGIALERGPPLCSMCGGGLLILTAAEAAPFVPGSVRERHRKFHRCVRCGQLYWRGSHWKKLSNLERAFGHRP